MNSIKKYNRKHKNAKWILSISVILIVSAVVIIKSIVGFNYKIVDYFYETNPKEKFVFMFTEVNKLDNKEIKKVAEEIVQSHIATQNQEKAERLGVLIYFYRKSDIAVVPARMHNSLKKKFQDKNVENNLRYVADGRIFMKFTSKNNLALDRDTLMSSEFIIPRQGVRAKNVMKRGKP
jgi:preprotein translocase subunit SecF